MDMHPGNLLIEVNQVRQIAEIQPRIYAQHIHIHGDSNNIRIAGALAIAKESALDTVCPSQKPQL